MYYTQTLQRCFGIVYVLKIPCGNALNHEADYERWILLTKTTAAQNEVVLSYHRVHWLYFQAVCGDYSYFKVLQHIVEVLLVIMKLDKVCKLDKG